MSQNVFTEEELGLGAPWQPTVAHDSHGNKIYVFQSTCPKGSHPQKMRRSQVSHDFWGPRMPDYVKPNDYVVVCKKGSGPMAKEKVKEWKPTVSHDKHGNIIYQFQSKCPKGSHPQQIRRSEANHDFWDSRMPSYVKPNDFVIVCKGDSHHQSALNAFVNVISAPITLPAKAVDKAFDAAGIPSPSKMLGKLGLPTPDQIAHGHFGAITDPKELLDKIPGIQKLARYIPSMPDPTKTAAKLVTAVEHGDLKGIKDSALEIGHQVADVASMVPGIGNVIGGPLASAITLLETGSPLKAALSLLLGEIPGIPPQIRGILRVAFNSIADVVEHQKSVTDILLTEFKKGVEDQAKQYGISGPVMHVVEGAINSAIQVIFHHKPLDQAALDLAKKGLNEARKKLGDVPAVKQAESELSDLNDVYKNVNSMHALTQGVKKITGGVLKNNPEIQKKLKQLAAGHDVSKEIVSLAKKGLAKANPVDLKKLTDLKTALEGLKAASHVQEKHIKKRHPPKLMTVPAPSKHHPPKLTTVLAPTPKHHPPKLATVPVPAPKQLHPKLLAPPRPSPRPSPTPSPSPPPATPSSGILTIHKGRYAPYPQSVQTGVSGPHGHPHGHPHHPHGGHPHFGGHAFPQRFYAGRQWPVQWWKTPWSPEVVTRTETCQTWGNPIDMPPAMQRAATAALDASRRQPTSVRGPDNVLYLFAYENGIITARPCAAVASS